MFKEELLNASERGDLAEVNRLFILGVDIDHTNNVSDIL
jgi:hypothetical protein